MRVVIANATVAVLAAAALAGACSTELRTNAGDGTLVLELGGEHGSLREALLAAGVVIEPRPIEPRSVASMAEVLGESPQSAVPPPAPVVTPDPGPEESDPPRTDPPRTDPPQPDPPSPARPREVALSPGETVSHLARRHLGSVRRYTEILELNGWTERESRRLPAGTLVKLPAR